MITPKFDVRNYFVRNNNQVKCIFFYLTNSGEKITFEKLCVCFGFDKEKNLNEKNRRL